MRFSALQSYTSVFLHCMNIHTKINKYYQYNCDVSGQVLGQNDEKTCFFRDVFILELLIRGYGLTIVLRLCGVKPIKPSEHITCSVCLQSQS